MRSLLQRKGESRQTAEHRLHALETVGNKVMHHGSLARSEEELDQVRGFGDELAALIDHLEAELARGEA